MVRRRANGNVAARVGFEAPFARPDVSLGTEADAALSALRVLKDYRTAYGNEGLGALIVSMTRHASDLLVVYLLAREVGLMEEADDGLQCPLPVVPTVRNSR